MSARSSAAAGPAHRGRVLLIEDDAKLAYQIDATLAGEGYAVRWIRRGDDALGLDLERTAMVVLDLMLPGADGFAVLREYRARSDVPILLLTARNAPEDRVRGLELGADDYLAKPFWPEELVARVRARLRRPALAREAGLRIGPLEIDVVASLVRLGGDELDLTTAERAILFALARRPGAALTRRTLAQHALDHDGTGDRNLDAHVSRLRRKLGEAATLVETVRGIGYRLRVADA